MLYYHNNFSSGYKLFNMGHSRLFKRKIMDTITIILIFAVFYLLVKNEILMKESSTDTLTGVGSRKAFDKQLERRMKGEFKDLSVLYIDINNFKKINDTQGHAAGDIALKEIATIIQLVVRKGDFVSRLGGDEYSVLLTHCSKEDLDDIIVRIHKMCELKNLSVSIGRSKAHHGDGITKDQLMRRADKDMYTGKVEHHRWSRD